MMLSEKMRPHLRATSVILFLLACFFSCNKRQEKSNEEFESLNVEGQSLDSLTKAFVPNDTSALLEWAPLGCCEYKGIYNPTQYSEAQLKDTQELLYGGLYLGVQVVVEDSTDIAKLSVEKLDEDYRKKNDRLKSLNIVPNKFWEDLRLKRINDLEAEYAFDKTKMLAYSDPSVLLESRFKEYCKEFVEALNSKDTAVLLDTWKRFAEEKGKENDVYLKKFRKQYSSKERLAYARITLTGYGWGNCVNHEIVRTGSNDSEKEFDKLFRKTYRDCRGCD